MFSEFALVIQDHVMYIHIFFQFGIMTHYEIMFDVKLNFNLTYFIYYFEMS